MEKLMILLLFPLVWPFIAKRIWHTTINWQEMTLQIVICVGLTALVWQSGKYSQTADLEVWNGKIVSKNRDHDHYVETYDCNCKDKCSGTGSDRTCTEVCETCYEDHYTVTWTARSTVGDMKFAHLDSLFSSVYNSPDPEVFKLCTPGEPASIEHSFTNYVKAVPESLFNTNSAVANTFQSKVPAYPKVYAFYKINRVLTVDAILSKDTRKKLNDGLNKELINLGASKQVNIILIITSITDPSYRYTIEQSWLGGKKNDVIIFIGANGDTIIWTDVMTWALNTGNELFRVTLRDELNGLSLSEPEKIVQLISNSIKQNFIRPKMKDFEYLKDAVEPPLWALVLAIGFAFCGSIGLTVLFHRIEIDFLKKYRGSRIRFS